MIKLFPVAFQQSPRTNNEKLSFECTCPEEQIIMRVFDDNLEIIFHISPYKHMDRVKRICYLSPMRAAKVQASLRIRAVSPEPPLLAHTSSESRGTFRQKARSLVPLNGWACAVEVCHDGMLEDTNSLDGAHMLWVLIRIASMRQFWCVPTKYAFMENCRKLSFNYPQILSLSISLM